MRQAIVSVEDGGFEGVEEVISALRDADLRDVEVLSCDWTGGVIRVRVEKEVDERRLDGDATVEWWERVAESGSGYVYLIELTAADAPATTDPGSDQVLPVELIEFDERGFTFDISGTQDGIRDVMAGFEDADVDLTLRGLRDYRTGADPLAALTARQREVLELAYERGYYDVPRGASSEAVAAELGVDDSTVAEHLQRAERNLLSTLLEG